jgi:large subunit ribosomal protein L19e
MVNILLKRKLIARTLGVGVDRVWLDPDHLDDIADIDTREDIRILLRKGYIKILPKKGQVIRRERRKRGPGSKKGKRTARISKKELWMMRVRAQRRFLRMLRDKGRISRAQYRKLYMMVKGGMFRSKEHLKTYIRQRLQGVE